MNKPFRIKKEKTIKKRLETEGLFVESRTQDEDLHLLVGKKDGSGNKAHIIIDGKTGEIRVDDKDQAPEEVVNKIETVLTLKSGRKIKSTREALGELYESKDSKNIEQYSHSKSLDDRLHLGRKFTGRYLIPVITTIIAGVAVYFLTSYQEPRITVNLASPALVHDVNGRSYLRYSLKNNSENTLYDIRKGHRIFNEKGDCLKHFYDTTDQYLLDLAPGEESAIHVDHLEDVIKKNESISSSLKIQLIITYRKSKNKTNNLYCSLVNLVLLPGYCNEKYCILSKPSSRFGSISKFIDECKEFNLK